VARPLTEEYFQNFRFHLFDVALAAGSLDLPLLALSPQLGFQSITPPTINVETSQIRPGNSPFPVAVVKEANISNVTLTRGVLTGDSEFYNWTRQAIYGRGAFRRTLLLIQTHRNLRGDDGTLARFGDLGAIVGTSLGLGAAGPLLGGAAATLGVGGGDGDFYARIWTLWDAIPVRYQPASTFDANDDGITMQELELDVEFVSEINPGPFPISQGWS
jgi:phage tail-like protein